MIRFFAALFFTTSSISLCAFASGTDDITAANIPAGSQIRFMDDLYLAVNTSSVLVYAENGNYSEPYDSHSRGSYCSLHFNTDLTEARIIHKNQTLTVALVESHYYTNGVFGDFDEDTIHFAEVGAKSFSITCFHGGHSIALSELVSAKFQIALSPPIEAFPSIPAQTSAFPLNQPTVSLDTIPINSSMRFAKDFIIPANTKELALFSDGDHRYCIGTFNPSPLTRKIHLNQTLTVAKAQSSSDSFRTKKYLITFKELTETEFQINCSADNYDGGEGQVADLTTAVFAAFKFKLVPPVNAF